MFQWVLNTSVTIYLPELLHAVTTMLFFLLQTGGWNGRCKRKQQGHNRKRMQSYILKEPDNLSPKTLIQGNIFFLKFWKISLIIDILEALIMIKQSFQSKSFSNTSQYRFYQNFPNTSQYFPLQYNLFNLNSQGD